MSSRALPWLSIVASFVSMLVLALAVGAGMITVLPARGGETLLRFASACMWSALGLAVLSLVLAGLSFRGRRSPAGASIVAVVLGAFATLASGGVAAGVGLIGAAGKHAEHAAKDEAARRATAVDAAAAAGAIAIPADDLFASWQRDPAATDARYAGKALAVTVRVAGVSFLDGTSRCAFPLGRGDMNLCLATAQADVNGPMTLVCRYGGTLNRYADKRPSGNTLVLEGCWAR